MISFSDIRHFPEYLIIRLLIMILRCFPERCTIVLLKVLFYFLGYVCGIRKRVVFRQLRLVFPEKNEIEIKTLAKAIYAELAVTVAEVFIFSDKYLYSKSEIVGIENVVNALSHGNGMLLVSGHFSNWELGAKVTAKEFEPILGVVKRVNNRFLNIYIDTVRRDSKIITINSNNALKYIVAALKKNKIVAILMDQYAIKQGVEMEFLGHMTKTYTSVAQIAIKYKTPVVFGFDVRDSDGNHKVYYHEPLVLDLELTDENVLKVTKALNERLEEYILKYPHLWFWVHRKWR